MKLFSTYCLFVCLGQVSPTDPIMLMANAVQEVHLTLRPHTSGSTRYMYVNVVGILCRDNNSNSNKVAMGSSEMSTSFFAIFSKLVMRLLLCHCCHCP